MYLSYLGLKSLHGRWLCWISTGRKNGLTLLELQSHFGGNPLKFEVVCTRNGTAVLKGLKNTHTYSSSSRARSEQFSLLECATLNVQQYYLLKFFVGVVLQSMARCEGFPPPHAAAAPHTLVCCAAKKRRLLLICVTLPDRTNDT